MPARHQGLLRLFIACALPLLALHPPPRTGSWRKWSSSAATVFVRRRPATGKPSRPPPDDRGPSGPPMTGAHRPWLCRRGQQRACGRPALPPARPVAGRMPDGGVDIRARQPAAADASDRRAGGWRLPRLRRRYPLCQRGCRSLFQTDKFAAATDPARQLAAVKEKAGDLAQRRQALAPTIQLLKQAVCQADKPCPIFDTPWQVEQSKSGKTTISGLSVMANMVETLRLGWSENLPLSQLAGQDHPAADHRPAAAVNGKLRSE